jgi:hypothetical protein
MLKPHVSGEVLQAILRAEAMHGVIQVTAPDRFILDNDEKILVVGLYSLVAEHHSAILYLLRGGGYGGSALALVRPLIDAAYRAHWIYSCAKPEIVERIKAGEDCYPGLINMAEAVEKKIDSDGFFTSVSPYIKALHGFTHGGIEQLGRRFDDSGNVSATYTDGELQEVISVTTAHLTALTVAWCQLISDSPRDQEPISTLISDKYSELYGRVDESV